MAEKISEFFVASAVENGAAARYVLYSDGTLERIGEIAMPNPVWLDITGGVLRAVLRSPFADSRCSGVGTYDISTGRQIGKIESTGGIVACHLAADGRDVYAANYLSGDLIKLPDTIVRHTGTGHDPLRQEAPHVHSVFLSPDGKYLLSCDLGLDTVFVYDRDLGEVSRASTPAGTGPRHLAFSNDGQFVYVINEMGASVSIFAWESGSLQLLDTVGIMPDGCFTEKDGHYNGKGAAIRLSRDGARLYVTERWSETISVFSVSGPKLELISRTSSYGTEPRDFILIADERFAVCTDQFADRFALFAVKEDGCLNFVRSEPLERAISAVGIPSGI